MENWNSSFENLKTCVLKGQLKGSDSAGVFWKNVNGFLRFLTREGKEDEPDVVALRNLFNGYTRLEGAEFKKAQLEILDLCLKICDEVQKRKYAAVLISAL